MKSETALEAQINLYLTKQFGLTGAPDDECVLEARNIIKMVRKYDDERDVTKGDDYHYGTLNGIEWARAVIEERFFGGPTKDMILGWLHESGPERESNTNG